MVYVDGSLACSDCSIRVSRVLVSVCLCVCVCTEKKKKKINLAN